MVFHHNGWKSKIFIFGMTWVARDMIRLKLDFELNSDLTLKLGLS